MGALTETIDAIIPLPTPPPNPKKRKREDRDRQTLTTSAAVSPAISKYYRHRYSLFSLYDRGIQMDEEGWFSVTPEPIAARHAFRASSSSPSAATVVIDGFAGVGGNAIQFALRGCHVVAIEIDPQRLEIARHNATIYGVEDMIDFVVGDFFQLGPHMKGDIVFLSPPWGGPSYSTTETFTLDLLKPKDGYAIFNIAQRIAPSVIMFLPRNVDLNQVEGLSWLSYPPLDFEIEENLVYTHVKGITAYFGDIVGIDYSCVGLTSQGADVAQAEEDCCERLPVE